MPLPPSITLRPAHSSDLPSISHLGAQAFLTDSHTAFKAYVRGNENDHEDGAGEEVGAYLANPRCDVIVAVERGEEEQQQEEKVVGWVCWAKRGYEVDAAVKDKEKEATSKTEDQQQLSPPTPPPKSPDGSPLTLSDLESYTNAAMTYYMTLLMPPGTRCRFIVGISIAPTHQGLGIGSALMRWGTDKCDDEGVFCWVSSSMGGWPAFERNGFVEFGRVEARLDEYAEGKELEREWGVYVWRWGKREPRGGTVESKE